jgi:hypothetical protein
VAAGPSLTPRAATEIGLLKKKILGPYSTIHFDSCVKLVFTSVVEKLTNKERLYCRFNKSQQLPKINKKKKKAERFSGDFARDVR